MNLRWLIPIPLGAAGFVFGYLQDGAPPLIPAAPRVIALAFHEQATRLATSDDTTPLPLAQRIALASQEVGSNERQHAFLALFDHCDLHQLRAITSTVLALSGAARQDALSALFARWIELDAPGVAEFAASAGLQDVFAILIDEWVAVDPEATAHWMRERKPDDPMGIFSLTLADRLRDTPAQAVELFFELPRTATFGALEKAWSAWAHTDPAAALARAMRVENVKRRADALRSVVQGWTEKDPHGAMAWFRQLSDADLRRQVAPGLLTSIAKADTAAALTLAQSLPEGRERVGGLVKVADAIFFTDQAASTWIVGEIPLDPGNRTLRDFYFQWSLNSDDGAALRSLLARAARSEADRAAVETFIQADASVTAMLNPEGKVRALAEVESAASDDFRRVMLEQSAASWAATNIGKALAWAEALPEGAVRERALAGVAAGWTWSSTNEVTAWLDTLPASPSRDAAVGGFAVKVLPRDPPAALAWLQTMRDADQRDWLLQSAWQQWAKADRAQAEQWRKTAPELSPAQRAALR